MNTATPVGLAVACQEMVFSLTGQGDVQDVTELRKQLLNIHASALSQHARVVRVNLADVEFMNSTGLGAFVSWIAELQKVAATERYKIELHGSSGRRWQRSSLHSLAAFGPLDVSVHFRDA